MPLGARVTGRRHSSMGDALSSTCREPLAHAARIASASPACDHAPMIGPARRGGCAENHRKRVFVAK
jgi:hypothetical protein